MALAEPESLGPARSGADGPMGQHAYPVLAVVLGCFLPGRTVGSSIGLGIGLLGGLGLNAYFAQPVPDKEVFSTKDIGRPLLICLLVFVPLLVVALYLLLRQNPV